MKKVYALLLVAFIFVSCSSLEEIEFTEIKPYENAFFITWQFKNAVNEYFRNRLASIAVADFINFENKEQKIKFIEHIKDLNSHDPIARILADATSYPEYNYDEYEVVKHKDNKLWVKRKNYAQSDFLILEIKGSGVYAVSKDNDISQIYFMGISTEQRDINEDEFFDGGEWNWNDMWKFFTPMP